MPGLLTEPDTVTLSLLLMALVSSTQRRNSTDDYARAERRTCSSGPRPAQHPANLPSITTAGTLRTPYCFALEATSDFCISWITTSCEDPARRLTTSIVSLHVEQPALKTSIFFFETIVLSSPLP